MKGIKSFGLATLMVCFVSTVATAKEIVVNAVSPTSDDYALAVVWSNLVAKAGTGNP